jgi:hypothetical protein
VVFVNSTPEIAFSSRVLSFPTADRRAAYSGSARFMNQRVNATITGATSSVTTARYTFCRKRTTPMPNSIAPSRTELESALSRKDSRFSVSDERMDITSPVCLSSKKLMSSRLIFSKQSTRTACITPWANSLAATPYRYVKTAVATNDPAMSATDSSNAAVPLAGSHASGTTGRVNAPPSSVLTAAPSTTGGTSDANCANRLATTPSANQPYRGSP